MLNESGRLRLIGSARIIGLRKLGMKKLYVKVIKVRLTSGFEITDYILGIEWSRPMFLFTKRLFWPSSLNTLSSEYAKLGSGDCWYMKHGSILLACFLGVLGISKLYSLVVHRAKPDQCNSTYLTAVGDRWNRCIFVPTYLCISSNASIQFNIPIFSTSLECKILQYKYCKL